uniref:DUF4283 domain-containing protein n=1 Tax=Kalanchoe fedtschenkoi TaxID=63787 RepID=A0A7N0USH0_KALFE
MVTWVCLHGLDPCFFWSGFPREIYQGVGSFLKADECTLCLVNHVVARVCLEINLNNPLVQGFWVSAERSLQRIEVEYGTDGIMSGCKKQGHLVEECRRELARRIRKVEVRNGGSSSRQRRSFLPEEERLLARQNPFNPGDCKRG